MSRNDFESRIFRRWQDKAKREKAERIRLAYEFAQCKPPYVEIILMSDDDVLSGEAVIESIDDLK